jgi:hypothetical protein
MIIKKLKKLDSMTLKKQREFWAKYLEEGKKNERRKIQRKIRRK